MNLLFANRKPSLANLFSQLKRSSQTSQGKPQQILSSPASTFIMPLSYYTVEAIGYIGGIILALASLPQLLHTYKTQSTKDISYVWQVSVIIGLLLNYVYFIVHQVTAAWVTLTVELIFAIILFVMKVRLDGCGGSVRRRKVKSVDPPTSETKSFTVDVEESLSSTADESSVGDDFHVVVTGTYHNSLSSSFGEALKQEVARLCSIHQLCIMCPHLGTMDGRNECMRGFCLSAVVGEGYLSAFFNHDEGTFSLGLNARGSQEGTERALLNDLLNFLESHVSSDTSFVSNDILG